ncbi:pentatricopeptide repeat-containing protein [Tanacetum coccineum]
MSSIDEDLSADEEIVLRRHIILRHTDEEQLQATSTSRCYRKGSMTGCVLFIRARDAPAQVDQYVRKPIKSLVTLISCVLALRAVIAPDVDVGSSSTNRMLSNYGVIGKGVCFEESLELLERMSGISPNNETFLILLGKFLQLNEAEIALKIWVKMKEHKVSPDSAHFMIMVEGLGKHGLTFKAKELRDEMLSIGIKEDPKLTKLFKDLLQKDEVKEIKKQKYVKRESRGAVTNVRVPFLNPDAEDNAFWIDNKGKEKAFCVKERLVFGAIVYYIWQERNARLFRDSIRSEEVLFNTIVETVRFKLLSLQIRNSVNVRIAARIWNLKQCKGIGSKTGFSMTHDDHLPCFVAVCLTLLDVLPAYGLCKGNGIKWFLHDFMNSAIGFSIW